MQRTTTGLKISNDLVDIVHVHSSMKQRSSEDKIKTMLKKSCRPENREALAPVPVNIAGCKCIRKRTLQTYIILQRNQCLICKVLILTVTVLDTMLSNSRVGQGLTQQDFY
jgi:ABC-type microcin C transport system duplicated ATPase subunit YejF